jgi:hypothetical protein
VPPQITEGEDAMQFLLQQLDTHQGQITSSFCVSRAFPSWNRSILTEIYLCHACSYHEIEDGNAPGQADEVFCGRNPNRGTETCTVVEQMASLEHAFATFAMPRLMDRVERL